MKMTDVFNLPLEVRVHPFRDDVIDCYADSVSDGDYDDYSEACVIAINNHDPLITFIEKLAAMTPTDNLDVKAEAVKILEGLK